MKFLDGDDQAINDLKGNYPTYLTKGTHLEYDVPEFATAYGYTMGDAVVDDIPVPKGYAFSALSSVKGNAVVVVRYGFRGMTTITKTEDRGRVQYIDGCTDSLLIMPPRAGDPCLNSLHFPKRINQTFHTHPSIRAGVIASGSGFADTEDGVYELKAGDAWFIDANEPHRFRTAEEGMTVIAYHPESNWGPTDEIHPMINRTYIKAA